MTSVPGTGRPDPRAVGVDPWLEPSVWYNPDPNRRLYSLNISDGYVTRNMTDSVIMTEPVIGHLALF